jgi:hypothetical protein
MHLYLSMLAGKSLPEYSCIRTSKENRNFRWVTTNFRGYLLFDDFEFLIIMFTHHLLLTSFPFTIVCLGRQDNDRLLAPSLHNGGPALSPILLSPQMVYYTSRHFVPHNKQNLVSKSATLYSSLLTFSSVENYPATPSTQ